MAVNMGPKIPSAMVSATLGSAYFNQGNAMLRALQALVQCNVISMTLTTPPGSPANGDTYIVAAGATGAWSGKAGQIAYWSADPVITTPAWEFYTPAKGWTVGNQADGARYDYSGTAWTLGSVMTATTSGLVPTPPNDSSRYLDGSGNFSVPVGGGGSSLADTGRRLSRVTVLPSSCETTSGEAYNETGTWTSFVAPSSGKGGARQLKSASTNTFAGFYGASNLWITGSKISLWVSLYVEQITNERFYVGLFDVALTPATLFATDAETAHKYACFRFSTVAGDTHIQCITCDGSAQNVIDSGVTPTTNSHTYRIEFRDNLPNVEFYIDGNLVATSATHLPSAGTMARYVAGVADEGAAAYIDITAVTVQADY